MTEDLLNAALNENKALKKAAKDYEKELVNLKELQGELSGDVCVKHARSGCKQEVCNR